MDEVYEIGEAPSFIQPVLMYYYITYTEYNCTYPAVTMHPEIFFRCQKNDPVTHKL